jgi:hypothetical protein
MRPTMKFEKSLSRVVYEVKKKLKGMVGMPCHDIVLGVRMSRKRAGC